MLARDEPIAFLLEGHTGRPECKMALGMMRYSPNPVVCAVDRGAAGQRLSAFFDLPRDCPILATVAEARRAGAGVLVIGTAPSGGRIPDAWFPLLDEAVALGMSIVNGLHDRLAPRYGALAPGQWIWDIRVEPEGIGVATGRAAALPNRRLLMTGTDMAIGKMTAGLEILREARRRGIAAEFVATGQIGIAITGRGVPLDAVRVDYACGAVEQAVLEAGPAPLVIVEGQGSLVHPGSTSTLPLMRGSCPTDLVLCHRAGQTHLRRVPEIAIPPLRELIALYEDLAATCGAFPRPRTAGIALNTAHLGETEARRMVDELAAATGVVVTDPVRFGAAGITQALEIG